MRSGEKFIPLTLYLDMIYSGSCMTYLGTNDYYWQNHETYNERSSLRLSSLPKFFSRVHVTWMRL